MSTKKLAIAVALTVVSYIVPIVTSFMIYVALIFHKKRTFNNAVAAAAGGSPDKVANEAPDFEAANERSLSDCSETENDESQSRNLPSFNDEGPTGDCWTRSYK